MKKELIRSIGYGLEYVIVGLVLLLLTGSIDLDCDAMEYVFMIIILLIPVVVMTIINVLRVYRENKLIEKIRKEVEAE